MSVSGDEKIIETFHQALKDMLKVRLELRRKVLAGAFMYLLEKDELSIYNKII